jgi:hypothetical protein
MKQPKRINKQKTRATPLPSRQATLSLEHIEAQLTAVFYSTAGSFPIREGCEQMMRDLISRSVTAMSAAKRTTPKDVEKARDSVRAFTLEMKEEARELNRDAIGEFTFRPVIERLQQGKRLGWWPFTDAA